METSTRYTFIDLFAGCGGLSLGLVKSGWTGLFAIEKNKMAFGTLKHNLIDKNDHFKWPSWLPVKEHDVNDVLRIYKHELEKLKGKVTLVAGGPPCQGFSMAGRRNEHDERNDLVNAYIDFIDIVHPRLVFFENVKGFTMPFKKNKSVEKSYSDYVFQRLQELGYDVHARIINFNDFGVPQKRKRFILVGADNGDVDLFSENIIGNRETFLGTRGIDKKVTLREAISDLERKHGEINSREFPGFKEGLYGDATSGYQKVLRDGYHGKTPDSHRFPNHRKETIDKFTYILENSARNKNIDQEIKERFQINKNCIIPLDDDKTSPTLTTLPDDYIHYSEPRILTVREYARIQSFDDWYEFKGNYTTGGLNRREDVPRYTQVGNAIPPLFMEQCGEILKVMT